MKKLLALSLLSLHLFSLCGNMVLYAYCAYQSNRFYNEQISKGKYNVGDLIEMKIPVKMPTITDWQDYAYVSGQVQFRNNSYNYVKIKMTQDTVYLLCVPNYEKTHLINQNIINARNIADIPLTKKSHVPIGKANALSEYNSQVIQFRFLTPGKVSIKYNNRNHADITAVFISRPSQPPDYLS